jgi:hypothetical protein
MFNNNNVTELITRTYLFLLMIIEQDRTKGRGQTKFIPDPPGFVLGVGLITTLRKIYSYEFFRAYGGGHCAMPGPTLGYGANEEEQEEILNINNIK